MPHWFGIYFRTMVLWQSVGSEVIGPHKDLLTVIKRHKVQRYWHVSRSSGLAKTMLQGTVKGGRRQGRQRKRWEDNIRKWTGLEFTKSKRTVENMEKWRKLVMKLCVVPHRPSRLRDRWWWWAQKWYRTGRNPLWTPSYPTTKQFFS